jgi:DNA-binding transcriptional ArsR family regulator
MYSDNERKNRETSKGLVAIDPEVVNELRTMAPADTLISSVAEMFHVLGDPTRLKILYMLMQHSCCVRDLAILTGVSESAISHQLKLLKDRRLVKQQREGTTIYYSLNDHHLGPLFQEAEYHVDHVNHINHADDMNHDLHDHTYP